ncbi:hypothetical protein OC846_005721 [Tilletia horrida]|uniref:Uncharacterized protein n=1 Tax=Tilletia horrida TaxID=155126 RepID=A0AAN6GKQ4_9BASI|nr:hypothetical protein OC845_005529 [Tilletia horrida]KAK0545292.1 hypothetical protein OC846_005721 [Tilletia horrida]KAK0561268.1 hypothetical protein OC861_005890 [Tilletia horrida]
MTASPSGSDFDSIIAILGHGEDSQALSHLLQVFGTSTLSEAGLERIQYSDILYLNLYKIGISFQLEADSRFSQVVTAVDIYNHHPKILADEARATKKPRTTYKPFPALPLPIVLTPKAGVQTQTTLSLNTETNGTDFFKAWGEPDRKGGGTGPIGRGPAAWMEWSLALPPDPSAGRHAPTPVQIMVELGGEGARGPRVWESDSAGASPWKVITFSLPPSQTN